MLTVDQAWEQIISTVRPVDPEPMPLAQAAGSILAQDIVSGTDSPPFDKSMMDGYAVCSSDLAAGNLQLRILEEIGAGKTGSKVVRPGQATRIMTGAPIPPGADGVVPVEWTTLSDDGATLEIAAGTEIRAGTNILPRGRAMRAGEVVLRAGCFVRAQEVALLAETGQACPVVRRRPSIAVLATGDELVEIDQVPGPGQIRNSNALMLMAQVEECGAAAVMLGIARDRADELAEKIRQGLKYDFLCLSGGVSAGKFDLVPSALEAAGVRSIFHKVAMKPGKPLLFGDRPGSAGKPPCYVFGLPGNPVSSMVCFELFVRTAVRRFLGIDPARPSLLTARLSEKFDLSGDRHTWFPARMFLDHEVLRVKPVDWKGSADLRSTVDANCSISVPPGEYRFEPDASVPVLPWGSYMPSL